MTGFKYFAHWIRAFFSRSWDLSIGEIPENCLSFKAESLAFGTMKNFSWFNTWALTFWITGELSLFTGSNSPCFLNIVRAMLALMLCPWVFWRGHFNLCEVRQALKGCPLVLPGLGGPSLNAWEHLCHLCLFRMCWWISQLSCPAYLSPLIS